MQKIGETLKKRRLELGYSLQDIHQKTKLSLVHLNAIENGDLDYFRHDLSYLKFFLQYYCQAVKLDYSIIKDEYEKMIHEYAETQLIKKQKMKEIANENIRTRVDRHQSIYKKSVSQKRIKANRIELQTILMIALIVIIVLILAYSLIKSLNSKGNTNSKIPTKVMIPESISPKSSDQSFNENSYLII